MMTQRTFGDFLWARAERCTCLLSAVPVEYEDGLQREADAAIQGAADFGDGDALAFLANARTSRESLAQREFFEISGGFF